MSNHSDRQRKMEQAQGLYEQGYNSAEIGELFDVHQFTVRRWLHVQGVTMRTVADRNRKYEHRKDSFQELTPTAAYYAGWLMADGNIGSRARIVQMELNAQDRIVLTRLKKFMGYTGPIASRTRVRPTGESVMVSLRVCDASQVINNLKAWGVVPRKSERSYVGTIVVEHQLQEFYFRGLFEGDGSVGRRRAKPYYPFLTVAGNPAVIDVFRDWCWQEVREVGSLNKRSRKTHVVTFSSAKAQVVHKRLYKSRECPRLQRKAKI